MSAVSTSSSMAVRGGVQVNIAPDVIHRGWREEWSDSLIAGRIDDKPHRISARKAFSTACWRYSKLDIHQISIGLDIKATRADHGPLADYIRAYTRHELLHAKHTYRDLKKLSEMCSEAGVPFGLLNLFEDARIEHLGRLETGAPFGWQQWETATPVAAAKTEGQQVAHAVFNIIQADGDLGVTLLMHDRVLDAAAVDFYSLSIEAKDTLAVLEICKAFIKRFPMPQSDMDAMASAMGERTADMIASLSLPDEDDELTGSGKADENESNIVDAYSRGDVLSSLHGDGDGTWIERGAALAAMLSREMRSKDRAVSTSSPSRRLNTRALATDADNVYRVREEQAKGRVKVAAVVDCSGSMAGEPSELARTVVRALSILARSGVVEGCVVLSVGYYRKGLTQTLRLPLSDEQIEKIEGNGSFENLEPSFKLAAPILRDMDISLCLTDGCITDSPLDVDRLRRQRMNILALYAGSGSESSDQLLQWFPQALHRPNLDGIEAEIATRFRRSLKRNGMR